MRRRRNLADCLTCEDAAERGRGLAVGCAPVSRGERAALQRVRGGGEAGGSLRKRCTRLAGGTEGTRPGLGVSCRPGPWVARNRFVSPCGLGAWADPMRGSVTEKYAGDRVFAGLVVLNSWQVCVTVVTLSDVFGLKCEQFS